MPPISLIKLTQILAITVLTCVCSTYASDERALENVSQERDLSNLSFRKLDLFGNKTVGRIQAIAQAPNGFMWIGTLQGLFRYDGLQAIPFHYRENQEFSLPDDSIVSLHFDSKDRFWIGTQRGLAKYDHEQQTFTSYLTADENSDQTTHNQVQTILHSNAGTVYASTEAGIVFRYDEEVDTFSPINGKPFGTIKSMVLDPENRLWIGTNNALTRYDLETGEREIFTGKLQSLDGVSNNYINGICYISEQEIWIGTSKNGLIVLDSTTGEMESMPFSGQPESYVNFVNRDGLGHIWATTNSGITVYDLETRKRVLNANEKNTFGYFPPSGVTAIWADNQGSIWAGSNYDGLSFSPRTKEFHTVRLHEQNPDMSLGDPVSAFLEDVNGNLWTGCPKIGVAMYPKDGGEPFRLRPNPDDPNSIADQPVLCLFEDSRNNIWIGTYRGGLFKYDPRSGNLEKFLNDPDNPYSISGHDIRGIDEDAEGNLWIATHGNGISKYDSQSGRFTNFALNDQSSVGLNILNNWVNDLLIDDQQRIWLATDSGISRIEEDRTSSDIFIASRSDPNSLSSSQTNHIFQDSKGRIWIATNDGLNRYLPETNDFRSYKVTNGFPHQTINSIVEDDSGILWMGTLDGLARFDPETERVNAYQVSDGLASNDFFEASAEKAHDGSLYFGQYRGLLHFYPNDIVEDKQPPKVYITELLAHGNSLSISPDGSDLDVLDKSILYTDRVELSYKKNALTFVFAAIDFISPSENQYRYKLDGFDEDWTASLNRNEAIYTNLNPGKYVFRVMASNKDGYWNETGDSLAIVIQPPYWGTIWFRVLVVIVIIALPGSIVLWRMKKIKKDAQRLEVAVNERTADLRRANKRLEEMNAKSLSQGEILERTVRQRTKELEIAKSKAEHSDNLKSAFLANMSHEIRTPMNAIIGFLHILDDKDLTETERDQFNHIIKQSSKSLMSLIDDILDLSTIEAGEAEISPQPCDVDEICTELGAQFRESLSAQKGESVSFRISDQIPQKFRDRGPVVFEIDPLRLKQILWNLISNAIKFTDEGEITLGYRIFENDKTAWKPQIEFTVRDTGIGIPKEQHQQIFNRFHKLDRAGKKLYRGTGLGLTITQTLTSLMGGQIAVDSTPGMGTVFKVTFPFKQSMTNPKDLQPAKSNSSSSDTDLSAFSLLVVEDEVPNYEYIERVLRRTGAAIHWAENGRKALDLFESEKIDLVLLDLKIPEIDGFEVARQIRSEDKLTPIIAQSAYAMREDHTRSIAAGANEHLSKPYSPDLLIETVARYLQPPTRT